MCVGLSVRRDCWSVIRVYEPVREREREKERGCERTFLGGFKGMH